MTTSKPRQRDIICADNECQNPAYARNLCRYHYQVARKAEMNIPCRKPGCVITPIYADGLCRMHYRRKNKPKIETEPVQFVATCRADNCNEKTVSNNFCARHYAANYRKEKTQREKDAAEFRRATCRIDHCRQPKKKDGLCVTHYDDFRLVRNQGLTRNPETYIQFKNKSQSE